MPDIATSEPHQRTASPEASAAAFHEAGHAVAIVRAFRTAEWLPNPMPASLVRYIEITQDGAGQWTGCCASANVYSVRWPIDVLVPPFRDLMERQVCIHLSGGISEAILCGVRGGREALRFAESSMDVDLTKAEEVLRDIFRLTGYRVGPQHYAERTLELLLTHWRSVEALASVLTMNGRVEGEMVEAIIDCA